MKASYGFCALAALLLCATAWLVSLLLADQLFIDTAYSEDPETVMLDIEQLLDGELADPLLIEELEYEYGVAITFKEDEKLRNNNDVAMAEDVEIFTILLDDGRSLTVAFPLEEQTFFTSREWLHLALQSLAALISVAMTILIMNNRLKVLDGATRDTQVPGLDHASTDPIDKAVMALKYAKQNIAQLGESQKSAASDHRDLLASVAHEFRNPLARLQFANEMAMERTGDEQKALFEEANIAAVELDELVRETLRYSRISSLDSALSLEYFPVEDIFRDIAESSSTAFNSTALRIQYPDQDYYLHADKRLFTRALVNLIDNGFRYAKSTVTLGVTEREGEYNFTVQDDGDGIATIHHDKLFEPFYRVERSRSRDTGGFGLGLSIVKSICDRHNASVSVSSDKSGTCFSIRFPVSGRQEIAFDGKAI